MHTDMVLVMYGALVAAFAAAFAAIKGVENEDDSKGCMP